MSAVEREGVGTRNRFCSNMSHLLLKAASAGDIARVRGRLDGGADVNYHSKDKQATGRTALTEAVIHGHLDVVRLLLERGAILEWQDHAVGFTPLGWAADQGHASIVEALLEAGADPNAATPEFLRTPLMAAAQRGNLTIVKLLIAAGANVNATTFDGRTALSIAQEKKRDDVVTLLAGMGAAGASPLPTPAPIPWPAVDETAEFCDFSAPEKVLRGFILAMNRWEAKAHELDKAARPASANQQIIQEMQQVFNTYCTPIARPYGRLGSYRIPPEYQRAESLIAMNLVNPRRAELITRVRQPTSETEYLYVALKKKGRWLIDNKKYRFPGATTWKKWTL